MQRSFSRRGVRQLLFVVAGITALALLGRTGPMIPDALGQTLPRIPTPTPTPLPQGSVAVLGAGPAAPAPGAPGANAANSTGGATGSNVPSPANPPAVSAAVPGSAPSGGNAATGGGAPATDVANARAATGAPVAPGTGAMLVTPVQQPVALPRTGTGYGHDDGLRLGALLAAVIGVGLLAGISIEHRRLTRRWKAAGGHLSPADQTPAPGTQRSSIP